MVLTSGMRSNPINLPSSPGDSSPTFSILFMRSKNTKANVMNMEGKL